MKKISSIIIVVLLVFSLSACTEENTDPCGSGTSLVDGVCVLDDDTSSNDDLVVNNSAFTCVNEPGLHTVPGGKMYTISAWLNWTFIGGHLVTNPDEAWIKDYGAAVFNVHTVASEAWEGSFTQTGMFLTEGCEYTFEFTLRTEAPNIKPDVIVFGETTNGLSFFEEVVVLDEASQTYEFVVTPETSEWVSTGVYFGGSTGMVVIEEIQIEREPIGTN